MFASEQAWNTANQVIAMLSRGAGANPSTTNLRFGYGAR